MYIYIFKSDKKITKAKTNIISILGLERIVKDEGKRDRKNIKEKNKKY